MAEIDIQNDLDAVNNQLATMAEELRKIESARENVLTQMTNLNGMSMYLRGKLATDENEVAIEEPSVEETLDREVEYPEETS